MKKFQYIKVTATCTTGKYSYHIPYLEIIELPGTYTTRQIRQVFETWKDNLRKDKLKVLKADCTPVTMPSKGALRQRLVVLSRCYEELDDQRRELTAFFTPLHWETEDAK